MSTYKNICFKFQYNTITSQLNNNGQNYLVPEHSSMTGNKHCAPVSNMAHLKCC